jgi:adenosylcobinamide-GDP ribazoletransferase
VPFAGLRLALTTLTVAPVRCDRVDRPTAGAAMALAPLVGLALGGAVAAGAWAALRLGLSTLLAGVLVVAGLALLTRGLHLDGLADTADGLASYQQPTRALDIMKRPEVGPFGVVVLVLVLLAQVAGAASVLARPGWAAAAGLVAATAAGRVAIAWTCRPGIPAARAGGLGALVAGTVPGPVAAGGAVAVALAAIPAVPGRPWQGPLAVALALAVVTLLVRHCVRRLGGITGDVLGAACETAVAVSLVVLAAA